MKKPLTIAAAFVALLFACVAGQAQEAAQFANSSQTFAALQADRSGTVTQEVLHAPAGDVLAAYIGRTSQEVYTKQDTLLIVLSGYGTATAGYPSYNLKPGSVLSIPRDTAFQITATGRTPIKAYLIATPNNDPNNRKILQP
jgi:mannose-6-phosphate isomerase-like protein (cupin superfamily)